ncbi:uncharacterized protein TRUGW13939_09181 [Talaromyces rugulosus]|uniref:Zn(2)-C6 fungal-type domain-containing protein n=1 Tax=Talaromyces rugulosus TaxID=121627 RepID=A0A7H8R8R6_TALRU|nr:uncharacterized protein TRUGW13939_09181 [Talaromyces rugulosus]QKX62025.1 hypothetical protein TRUGW13939_09181 [Talaromyces rugulosus]
MDARFGSGSGDKRPRSPSGDFSPGVASKMPKTQSSHLHINYLARQYPENLPLVSTEDNLPNILRLIGEYDGVLQRHESIAGNLGACPLGPILMKRFERLFDGPPNVLKSNGKEGTNVTWLDVVEFARNKPEQFNLEKTRNGVPVCQFYTKQCRVEISEEDYVLIASGMPQKLIPPQPIDEDEEKEVGSLEILEKNLQQITAMADSAAARARQLSYRLKSRRNAIVTRRETDRNKSSQSSPREHHVSPDPGVVNGHSAYAHPQSPPGGFTAVNSGRAPEEPHDETHHNSSHPNTDNITIINGTNIKGASPTTRAELMKKFFTTADQNGRGGGAAESEPPASSTSTNQRPRDSDASDFGAPSAYSNNNTVAIPNTPSSLLPQPKPNSHHERDDGGPFKTEMVTRMDELQRGERIMPPCDRCRRLHMDCLKNLTACAGCTKKHAKCSWKDVKEEELHGIHNSQPLNSSTREGDATYDPARSSLPPTNNNTASGRADSTSSAPVHSSLDLPPPMRRTNSEIHAVMLNDHHQEYDRHRIHQRSSHASSSNGRNDDDPDATSRLLQAIMDTVDRAGEDKRVRETM